ncbi:MAG: DUF1810 domain-containing protein [Gammaproteobacteria bacterium]
MSHPYDLQRFVDAQDRVYARVVAELRAGRKTSHWMWFVFPQVAGLGSSPMAQQYAISSLAEATAYLDHPVLGARLRECTQLVLDAQNRDISDIFPYPDDLKFHSSMTLFALADGAPPFFDAALGQYFNAEPDVKTLEILGKR